MARKTFSPEVNPGSILTSSLPMDAPVVAPVAEAVRVAPPLMEPEKIAKPRPVKVEVRAKAIFADVLTGKNFKAGDVVDGWDEERVAHYAKLGLVAVHNAIGPTEFK